MNGQKGKKETNRMNSRVSKEEESRRGRWKIISSSTVSYPYQEEGGGQILERM